MKQQYCLVWVLLLVVCCLQVEAQRVSYRFSGTSLSEVLKMLDGASNRYEINFIYNELEDFTVTTNIHNATIVDAVKQAVGYYPMHIVVEDSLIVVECVQKERAKVIGRVIDERGAPIAFANIMLLNPSDSAYVNSGVSNAAGDFVIPCELETVIVRISFVGYKTIYKRCRPGHIGSICLTTASAELGNVVVKSQRPLIRQEIDRIAYDVQADVSSRTSSVLEMLRKVPLVSVDVQDHIRVNGETSYKIYRNGHPDPSLSGHASEVLKTMPASSVKRIEVITDPGAKYDAEGTTVILNLVMQDNALLKGIAGSVKYTQSFPAREQVGLSLMTKLGKVVASANYSFSHDGEDTQHLLWRSTTHNQVTGNNLESKTDTRGKIDIHYGHLNASWEPDSLNLISMTMGGYLYHFAANSTDDAMMRSADEQLIYRYASTSAIKQNYYNLDGRIDYEHRSHRQGEAITLSYMIDTYRQTIDNTYRYDDNAPVPYTGIDRDDKQRFAEHTFQLDWTRPFAQWHKIETGVKYIYRLNHSHAINDYLGIDEQDNLRFNHDTSIGAAYVSYTYSRGSWSARAGLRYEHSSLRATYPNNEQNNFMRHLNDWVPNASIYCKLDNANSLKLAYNSGISRPGIELLNPAVEQAPTSRSYGNPLLHSGYNHKISFTWMRLGRLLTTNLSTGISFQNNGLTEVKWADGDIAVSTYGNQMRYRQLWLSVYAGWQPFGNTNLSLNSFLAYTHCYSDNLSLTKNRFSTSVNATLSQKLPWRLRLSAYVGLVGGEISSLYSHRGYAGWYGVGLQRSFLKENRLSLRLRVANFLTGWCSYMNTYTTQGDVVGCSTSRIPMTGLELTVSYRLGSLKTHVKTTEKTIENDDLVGSGKVN